MIENLRKFFTCLELDRKVVGVRFLFNEDEYEKLNIKPARTKLSYCMMVNMASKGHSVKVRDSHFLCSSSARALGVRPPSEKAKSGEDYFSYGMYNTLDTAKSVFGKVEYIDHKIYGLEVRPIEEFKENPHVVIVICTPYNGMRLMQGYAFENEFPGNIGFVGNQGLCSELTARPYNKKDINVSFLCSNTRYSCNWGESEIGVGMTYEIFEKVVNGVVATMNHVEPDMKKERILIRAEENNIDLNVVKGKNYYDSCLGVAKLD